MELRVQPTQIVVSDVQHACIVEDERLPVPAAATPQVVLVRPDATPIERRRALAIWLLARTGALFSEDDVRVTEMLLR